MILEKEIENPMSRPSGVLYVEELEWQPNNNSFCAELSMLRSFSPSTASITIKNPKSGNSRMFNFLKEEKDSYWLYENPGTAMKLFIWND